MSGRDTYIQRYVRVLFATKTLHFYLKDARFVSLYPCNRSQILQYVKCTI